jgi:hypothetical protein
MKNDLMNLQNASSVCIIIKYWTCSWLPQTGNTPTSPSWWLGRYTRSIHTVGHHTVTKQGHISHKGSSNGSPMLYAKRKKPAERCYLLSDPT